MKTAQLPASQRIGSYLRLYASPTNIPDFIRCEIWETITHDLNTAVDTAEELPRLSCIPEAPTSEAIPETVAYLHTSDDLRRYLWQIRDKELCSRVLRRHVLNPEFTRINSTYDPNFSLWARGVLTRYDTYPDDCLRILDNMVSLIQAKKE